MRVHHKSILYFKSIFSILGTRPSILGTRPSTDHSLSHRTCLAKQETSSPFQRSHDDTWVARKYWQTCDDGTGNRAERNMKYFSKGQHTHSPLSLSLTHTHTHTQTTTTTTTTITTTTTSMSACVCVVLRVASVIVKRSAPLPFYVEDGAL